MIQSIDDQILKKVKKVKGGSLFFTEDFLAFGSAKAASKALEKLVKEDDMARVTRGIYARLAKHPILGTLQPTTEAISRRAKARIILTLTLSLKNVLGLSRQVLMNAVCLTDVANGYVKPNLKSLIE